MRSITYTLNRLKKSERRPCCSRASSSCGFLSFGYTVALFVDHYLLKTGFDGKAAVDRTGITNQEATRTAVEEGLLKLRPHPRYNVPQVQDLELHLEDKTAMSVDTIANSTGVIKFVNRGAY
jgi:hypothetical protein